MSLIRVRRRRKKQWLDTRKGRSTGKLLVFLLIVVGAVWYLNRVF